MCDTLSSSTVATLKQDRESFIELKDVLKVDIDGNVIGKEKHKRLIDAFIEDCKACCVWLCDVLIV